VYAESMRVKMQCIRTHFPQFSHLNDPPPPPFLVPPLLPRSVDVSLVPNVVVVVVVVFPLLPLPPSAVLLLAEAAASCSFIVSAYAPRCSPFPFVRSPCALYPAVPSPYSYLALLSRVALLSVEVIVGLVFGIAREFKAFTRSSALLFPLLLLLLALTLEAVAPLPPPPAFFLSSAGGLFVVHNARIAFDLERAAAVVEDEERRDSELASGSLLAAARISLKQCS
jgi:hypothetical protein